MEMVKEYVNGKNTTEFVKAKGRNNSFQGLRAIAFMAIFVSHTGIGNFGAFGAWGVSVFFVLSGFLMIYNYYPRENTPDFGFRFAWSKIKKLYSLHIVTMLLAAVFAIYIGNGLLKTFLDAIIHSLLIQMWIPNTKYYTTLNGPAWYLCASFFIYLCFPMILKFFKKNITKKKAVKYLALFFVIEILISIATLLLNNHNTNAWFCTQWITYYFPPIRLIDFCVGCCLGYLYLKRSEIKKNYFAEIVTCVFIVLSLLIYMFSYGLLGSQSVKYTLLFLPTTVSLIWLVSNEKSIISRVLAMKGFVKLGDLSPYTFLIHGVVIKYCNAVFSKIFLFKNYYITSVIAFALTVLFAILWIKINKYISKNRRM